MGTTLPNLTPAQQSVLITLGSRAIDSRLSHPFLGDAMADEVIRKTGYDVAELPKFGMMSKFFDPRTLIFDVAVRAKKLDEVVQRFISHHPDAVVLDLGVGLDTRIFRVNPASTAGWYGIDFPEVIDLRQQVVPQRTDVHSISADLTEPHWLDDLPSDRPAVIVADGLVPFLPQDGFVSMLNHLIDHFPSGELAFNAYTTFAVKAAKGYLGAGSAADGMVNPGFDDPHAPEQWAPGLTLIEEIFLTRVPENAGQTLPMRLWSRLAARSTALSRRGTVVFRYRF